MARNTPRQQRKGTKNAEVLFVLGSNLVKGAFGNMWLYLVGPLAGGALAAVIFRITNPGEFVGSDA